MLAIVFHDCSVIAVLVRYLLIVLLLVVPETNRPVVSIVCGREYIVWLLPLLAYWRTGVAI